MINIAVMEGWAGGPWLSKEFRAGLKTAGFNLTDPQHADVLFAHSTACYDLPLKSPVSIYFLIDPPYWPGKSILGRVIANRTAGKQINRQPSGWKLSLQKALWQLIYILKKPRYSLLAIKSNLSLDFLGTLKGKQVVVIRNQQDFFCSPEIQVALGSYPNVRYAVLPGGHDDYMTDPKPYIDLLYKAI